MYKTTTESRNRIFPFFKKKNAHILNILNISVIIMGVGKEFGTIFDFYLFKY